MFETVCPALILIAGGTIIVIQYGLLHFANKFNNPGFLRRGLPSTVKTFVFLKTHKTGSGTLTGIFSRFADNHNLEMALPMKEVSRFSWPSPFTVDEVDLSRLKNEKANVLCHHAVFGSKSEFDNVMYPGTKYLTILRDPVERFESQFFYDKFNLLFDKRSNANVLLSFLNARKSTGWKFKNMTFEQKEILRLFTNGMLFDLTGELLDEKQREDDIDILIKDTENDFDLVLLTEFFDEGLVLLRQTFGWTFLDLVYKRNHVRENRHKELLTSEVRDKIIDINRGDFKLYRHFLKIFKEKVQLYGEKFSRHLNIFRSLNKEIGKQCHYSSFVINLENVEDLLDKFELSSQERRIVGDLRKIPHCFCSQLHRDEVSYVKYFRNKYEPYHFVKRKQAHDEKCL
eukprot:gene4869-21196_t